MLQSQQKDVSKKKQSLFSMLSACAAFLGESLLLALHSVTALLSLKILSLSWRAERGRRVCATGLGQQEYTDSGSHIVLIRVRQAVRHVEEFSCSLADCLERRKKRF